MGLPPTASSPRSQIRPGSSAQGRRGAANYITDPSDIQLMAEIVDEACQTAIDQGMEVNSFEDFQSTVETYSQAQLPDDPIQVELCEIDGAVRGFRFSFASEPDRTITGKHLAEKSGQPSHEYTPGNIARCFGFESNQTAEKPNPSRQRATQTQTAEPQSRRRRAEVATAPDTSGDTSDADDDFDEAPPASTATTPAATSPYRNALEGLEPNLPSTTAVSKEATSSAGDFDDELGEDDWKGETGSEPTVPPVPDVPDIQQPRSRKQGDPAKSLLDEAATIGRNAASQGHELDGVNLVGTAVQVGVAAAAIGRALFQNSEDEDVRALKELQKRVEEQSARLDPLGQRLENKIAEVAQTQTETEPSAPESEVRAERAEVRAEEAAPEAEVRAERAEVRAEPVAAKTEALDPIAESLNGAGDAADRLGKKAAEVTGEAYKPIERPEYSDKDDIKERIAKLTTHLEALTQKIDKIEARIDKLEELITQKLGNTQAEAATAVSPEAVQPNSAAPATSSPTPIETPIPAEPHQNRNGVREVSTPAAKAAVIDVEAREVDESEEPTEKQKALGQRFIQGLETIVPDEFDKPEGKATVELEDGNRLRIHIRSQPSGDKDITGVLATHPHDPVFEGRIQRDGEVKVQRCTLPDPLLETLGEIGAEPETEQPDRSTQRVSRRPVSKETEL
jgi:hypothetical protein